MSRVFFTDRDLGHQFPDILANENVRVEKHSDHFPQNCPDDVWLAGVAQRGWIAISHDQRIRYKPNERNAVVQNGVALLVVVGKAPFSELAHNFVATLPKIDNFLNRHKPPFIAKVYRPSLVELAKDPKASGSVSLWYQV